MVLRRQSIWVPEVFWVATAILLYVAELHHLLQEVGITIVPVRLHCVIQGLAPLPLCFQEVGDESLQGQAPDTLSLSK